HCAVTDDDAKRSQHRTHVVSAQRAVGDVKCGRDSHLFVTSLKTLHGYMGVRCALAAASRLWPRPTILLNLGRCLEALRDQMIIEDNSVAHDDVALRVGGDVLLVSHHDNRDSALVELLKNRHDLDTGPAVDITTPLIREQHLGIIDQLARDRHPSLLGARELPGMINLATGEAV